MLKFIQNEKLSGHTTISLGGIAKKFISCADENAIIEVLKYSITESEKIQIISGGSNIIFQDKGYNGIVMKINNKGIKSITNGDDEILTVKAGESWDDFVKHCISEGYQGIECMSGIPGSVGATPVQNVGAYGQEVKDVIASLKAINRETLENIVISKEECNFRYRQSRFKNTDRDKFIITEVTFVLNKNKSPEIKYPELEKYIRENIEYKASESIREKLEIIRKAVIALRKKKSMVIDEIDPNSKSCGSFFTNPVITEKEFNELKSRVTDFPFYKTEDGYKIPAAWLIENSGFRKGYRLNGAGISENHSLAIINCGGKTADILKLAMDIELSVLNKFGIRLEKEPVIVD